MAKNSDRLEKKSPDWIYMSEFWDMVANITQGQKSIREKGEHYLPKFPDETQAEYDYRLSLTKFTNIYRDILEGLASKPFQQEIILTDADKTLPDQIASFIEDVDGSGNNITIFSMDTFFNGINNAIDWIFVDYSANETGVVRSQADEAAAGLRPFWSHVLASNVYEVRSKIIAGKEQLEYIRIFEPGEVKAFREMERTGDGKAIYTVWKWNAKAEDYLIDKQGAITIGVIPMVPFVTGRRNGKSFKFFPPMRDAADLQIKLYQAESNLEYTKTVAAFPMLVGEGVAQEYVGQGADKKAKRLVVGPGTVLYAPPNGQGVNGTWKYISPGSAELTFLKADVADIKQDLRELGRQPLTANSGNLTVITTAVAAGKSKSAVKTWGVNLTDTLTLALYYTALWYGLTDYEPSAKVYDEYDDFLDPGADISSLITMANQGKLSMETLWSELKRRNLLSKEFNAEKEKLALLAETPEDPVETTVKGRF